MGVYTCEDGTMIKLNLSQDGTHLVVDESTSEEDRAKFWESYNGLLGQYKPNGIDFIAAERQRQINMEGWTAEHDQQHSDDELAKAAVCYATPDGRRIKFDDGTPHFWPWNPMWWKPSPDERIRELTKAGALIAAEIDRLLIINKPIVK